MRCAAEQHVDVVEVGIGAEFHVNLSDEALMHACHGISGVGCAVNP